MGKVLTFSWSWIQQGMMYSLGYNTFHPTAETAMKSLHTRTASSSAFLCIAGTNFAADWVYQKVTNIRLSLTKVYLSLV